MLQKKVINEVMVTTQRVVEQNRNVAAAIIALKAITHTPALLIKTADDRIGLTEDDKQHLRGVIDFLERKKIDFYSLEKTFNNDFNTNCIE